MKKEIQYFTGYFLVFPIIFILIFLLWRAVIQGNELWRIFSDATSILGLYYLITTVFFCFFLFQKFK